MAHLAHYKEAHPLPFVITHWINAVAMIFLIITGFMIHFPVAGTMGVVRGLHVFFGFVIFINCLARVIMSFFVKSAPTGGTREQVKDFKTWLPQKDNRHQAGAWIKYYLFLKKDHPLSAKLGVPQKLSYLLIPILIILMFITGLCLWAPTMELGFCMLIRAGVVAGEYDPSNTMLWRDLLFPFAMEGIAVVICALWLYPLKNWLVSKINMRFVPLFLSFVINGAVCTLMELIGGLLVNADHSLWDYSDMFCNFMGQICLQNAVGFGLACTLIVWIVYPAMERAIARIPGDVMNVAFVGCLAFNLILQVLYLVEPAEIANAFTIWGQVLSGNATATFIALPLLGQLRF